MKALLITGPTGIGKSNLVRILESKVNSVIINTDAFQIYSSIPIITARPELSENYYLYGHVHDYQSYSVGHWLKEVSQVLNDISKTDPEITFIFVGGTGLYFSKLIYGISQIPRVTSDVKKRSSELYNSYGIDYFLNILEKFDQISYSKIDRNNARRVLRAWEVLETSGKPISFWHTNRLPPLISVDNSTRCVLNISKGKLDSLNSERFKKMLSSGAVEECDLARKNGMTPICQSFKAIGVSEIFQYLDGHIDLDEVKETAIIRTRQYSKRQMTWFRNNFNDWDWYSVEKLNHSQIAKMIITNINKL